MTSNFVKIYVKSAESFCGQHRTVFQKNWIKFQSVDCNVKLMAFRFFSHILKTDLSKFMWCLKLNNRQPTEDDSIQIVADQCNSSFTEHADDEVMIAAEKMIVERSTVDLQPLQQTATPIAKPATVHCSSIDQPTPTGEIIEQAMFNASPNTSVCSSMFDTANHDYMSFTAYLVIELRLSKLRSLRRSFKNEWGMRTTVKSDEVCSLSRPSSP
uniref:Uncharacterized protein n=1 Tax=Romanomermis culicivorax TaxID=13658 RepID=A0A915KAC1_ROMCU